MSGWAGLILLRRGPMASLCVHGNETSGSIQSCYFL